MEMAAAKNGGGPEWRVTVPEGASVTVEHEAWLAARAWAWLASSLAMLGAKVRGFGERAWRIGADDPRRAVHGLKVGLALALVSVFYYTRPLYDGVGGTAMWAVMTVVVVFEYTVGGCVYKGFNRAAATVSAGAIALGVHWIADHAGHTFEPFIRSGSVFLVASLATFSRFIPTVKARFDYGVTIFILTYSLVAVSGYRVSTVLAMAQQRVCTVGIGISMCLSVSAFVRPVWAGQELHGLTARNMDKLAGAVEACAEDYFAEETTGQDKQRPSSAAKAEGYKCVLGSKASEDAQASLARWEPAHGRFGFRHPYEQYKTVGAAMRRCAYCVEALRGCVRSGSEELTRRAPEDQNLKRHLAAGCARLAEQCARVIREAASSVGAMAISRTGMELALAEMNAAVQELQRDLRALPSMLAAEGKEETAVMDAVRLFTVASLLVEVSARVEGVVDAVDTLARLAAFRSADVKAEASDEMGTKVQEHVQV